jgi:hypothetical protein
MLRTHFLFLFTVILCSQSFQVLDYITKWGAYQTAGLIYQPKGHSPSKLINQLSDLHLVSGGVFKSEFIHWNQNTPWWPE